MVLFPSERYALNPQTHVSLEHEYRYDQLINEMQKDNVFVGYEEGDIRFKPTYKYAKNTVTYDRGQGKEGKIRVPAWCDRILWRKTARAHALVRQLHYDRETCIMSDHMPVVAIFEVGVKNRLDDERVARNKRINGVLNNRVPDLSSVDQKTPAYVPTVPPPHRQRRGHFRSNSKVSDEVASVRSTTIYFNIQVARKSENMKRFLKMQSAIHSMLNRLDLLFLRRGIANACRIVPLPLIRLDSNVSYSGTYSSTKRDNINSQTLLTCINS